MNRTLSQLAVVILVACSVGCTALSKHSMTNLTKREIPDLESQFLQAREVERNGEIGRARQLYREILAQDPSMGVAAHRLGVIEAKQGNLDESLAHLEQARSLDPKNAEILTDIGYVLYMQNRLVQASSAFREALTQTPDNQRALNNLGLVLGRQGRFNEAYAVFRNVGSEAEALASLGYVYAQLGELDKAEQSFSRALDHDPELRVAATGLLQLREARQMIVRARSRQQAEAGHLTNSPPAPGRSLQASRGSETGPRQNATVDDQQRRSSSNVQQATFEAASGYGVPGFPHSNAATSRVVGHR